MYCHFFCVCVSLEMHLRHSSRIWSQLAHLVREWGWWGQGQVHLLCGSVSWVGLCGQTVLLTPTNRLPLTCVPGKLESVKGNPNSAFPPGTEQGLCPGSAGLGLSSCWMEGTLPPSSQGKSEILPMSWSLTVCYLWISPEWRQNFQGWVRIEIIEIMLCSSCRECTLLLTGNWEKGWH